jgi:hypothetical protein
MRVIGSLLIIGILLSYVPIFPMDECPDGNHMGNVMKMDCGSIFHCPLISAVTVSDPFPLPLSGRVFSTPLSFKVDGLPRLIYHPPKHSLKNTLFEVG